MKIRRIDQTNGQAVDALIVSRWFAMQMVAHGQVFDLATADGLCAYEGEEIVGLITYQIDGDTMEILSLDSLVKGQGIGTALLEKAVEEARQHGCSRVMLITTNDNLAALRFYQKRGFDMVALHRNALDQARALKPEIPLLGEDGIPLRHEIELELQLNPESGI